MRRFKGFLLALTLLLLGVAAGAQDFIRFYPPQIGTTSAGAFTFTGPLLLPDGDASNPSLGFAGNPDTGLWRSGASFFVTNDGASTYAFGSTAFKLAAAVGICWTATSATAAVDTCVTRAAAATLQLGATDAAAPVNQTLQAQGVAAGTSDVSGADFTITSGNGRGNAAGSNLIFRTPAPVGGGSGAQTMTTRFTLNASGANTAGRSAATSFLATEGYLTAATMSASVVGLVRTFTHSYSWTNAMLTAGAAATTWDVTVATLPAQTQLLDAMVVITAAQTSAGTLSVQCGDDATFVNYVLAGNAKAAANTVYGDAVGERGTAIDTEFWYLPSYTGTTAVKCRFISDSAMSTMTASTGRVILTTRLLP